MLRITAQYGAKQAVAYHRHHLAKGDYFTGSGEELGIWGGKLAERLNLSGHVEHDAWANLCYNLRPDGSGPLTPATRSHRRVSFDFTFNCPKSVSLAHSRTSDRELIRTAFDQAVRETMQIIKADAETRVRRGGASNDRNTGNLLWAEYVHMTTRPVDGIPQPHLHAHVVAINAIYDEKEQRIKAAQFGSLKRDCPYYQAQFHHRLAGKLKAAGFGMYQSPTGWELAGYRALDSSQLLCDKSKMVRKLLLSFLALLMLTPSLACAMPVCLDLAQNVGASLNVSDHHAMEQHSPSDHTAATPVLLKDCMGVDFQLAEASPPLKTPDLKKDSTLAVLDAVPASESTPAEGMRGNRGPPDWPGLFNVTSPSIILSTQRRLI